MAEWSKAADLSSVLRCRRGFEPHSRHDVFFCCKSFCEVFPFVVVVAADVAKVFVQFVCSSKLPRRLKIFGRHRDSEGVHSSVVEHGIADPAVTGSNPVVPSSWLV